jgi:anthrone oxygenase-like protein
MSLQDLAVLAAALLAGGQIFVLFVVLRTMRHMRTLDSFHLHQAMLSTDYPDAYIQPAGIVMFILGAILLGLERRTTANVVLTVIPMVCIATIIVLTRTNNRPINRKLGTWTDADVERYPPVRRRWDVSHAFRTLCGTTGLVAYIILANH